MNEHELTHELKLLPTNHVIWLSGWRGYRRGPRGTWTQIGPGPETLRSAELAVYIIRDGKTLDTKSGRAVKA